MLYKFDQWWQHLGLTLIGVVFVKTFSPWTILCVFIAVMLLAFAHSFDDRKKYSIIYGILALVATIGLKTIFQMIIVLLIMALIYIYRFAKYMPISAIYKAFGYSLFFFLPIEIPTLESVLLYFLLCSIAFVSELFHEASHYDIEKKEGRTTTAIFLNFKVNKNVRRKVKFIVLTTGIIILLFLLSR